MRRLRLLILSASSFAVATAPPVVAQVAADSRDLNGDREAVTLASEQSRPAPSSLDDGELAARVNAWFEQTDEGTESRVPLILAGGVIGALLLGTVGWAVESNSEACEDATGSCGQRGALIGGVLGAGFGVAVGLLVSRKPSTSEDTETTARRRNRQ